jgi:hypothetical protein
MPVPLPPQRTVFMPVQPKPPGAARASNSDFKGKPLLAVRDGFSSQNHVAFEHLCDSSGESSNIFAKSVRPLLAIVFTVRPPLHHSLVLQMDGLLHACFRLRLERDVCALAGDTAFCEATGPSVSPAATYCGLYWPAPHLLSAVLNAVKHERGYGIFVGPAVCDSWKLLSCNTNQRKANHLTFSFKGPDLMPWCGIFCSFAYQGKIKRKKPDTVFALEVIVAPQIPLRVALLPCCPARVSALQHIPVASDDKARKSAPLPPMPGIPRPLQSSVWNVAAMERLALLFPHLRVAMLFKEVIQPSGARLHFAGDNNKRVVVANAALEPTMLAQIKERFLSETAKGRMLGPFDRCPFPNDWNACQARATPLDTRKKDKYDPLSERFRVVSNFSAGRASSINNLIYSPKLLSAHLQSSQLRDLLFSLGPGARFSAIDQQDAFRADHINLADAHLYCYQVEREWFIDLRNPFGNVKSEYAYAIIVAVLKWAFEGDCKIVTDDSKLLGYVDNWFLLSRAECATHDSRWEYLKTMFDQLGAPMHEEQSSLSGTVNALGWDWDMSTNMLVCPLDKYTNCLRLSAEWALRASANEVFTFNEIDSIAGLFQWISTACPAIIPAVASLQALKHGLKASSLLERRLDSRSTTAVIALEKFFRSWSRSCPLFAGFSPVANWEHLIRVDASTDFGTGGFCVPSLNCFIHAWSASERALALAHSTTPLRESTTFFELQGILLILTHFAPLLRGKRVQIECDNEAAVRDLGSCFSGKPQCMSVIAQIRDLCADFTIIPRFEHILAGFNCVADQLSHNLFPQASAECQRELMSPLRAPHRE